MEKPLVCVFTDSAHFQRSVETQLKDQYKLVFPEDIRELMGLLETNEAKCLIASLFQKGVCYLSDLAAIQERFEIVPMIFVCTGSQFQTVSVCSDRLASDFLGLDEISRIHQIVKSLIDKSDFQQQILAENNAFLNVPPRVKKASKIIHAGFTKIKLAEEVSRQLGISTATFQKEFRIHCGISFTQYLILLKLKYATWLGENRTLSQKEIAKRCGYEDSHQFAHLFKQKVGMTFTQFRSCCTCDQFDTFFRPKTR